jgi:hypothetical protein
MQLDGGHGMKVVIGSGGLIASLIISVSAAAAPTLSGPLDGPAHLGGITYRVPLSERGYTEEEYLLSGTATSYTMDGTFPADGRATVKPADTAPYTTRIVVRRPSDLKKFNGTVVVEWLNVSAGTDGSPDYGFFHRHLLRAGYAWVGVSVQKAGIDGVSGMPSMAKPIKAANPTRYEKLAHPGDAYSFDIFSQAGMAIRGTRDAPAALRALKPKKLIADGESQSAFYMVTYVNAVDPLARVYDGFLIHARGGSAVPLTGIRLDRANADFFKGAVRIREDVRVPVLTVQSETDVVQLASVGSRQPDSKHFRLWEIAGASHADTYLLNASFKDAEGIDPAMLAGALKPTDAVMGMKANSLINSGPQQHYVMHAAIEHLNRWVRGGKGPPSAPTLQLAGEPSALVLDEHGNARGGIRSPWVDVPTAKLSGLGQSGAGFAVLFGTTQLFDAARLAALYPGGRAEYLKRFASATAAAVKAGFILEADQQEINAIAAAMYPGQ